MNAASFEQFKVGYDHGHVVLYCQGCWPWDMRLSDHTTMLSLMQASVDHYNQHHAR